MGSPIAFSGQSVFDLRSGAFEERDELCMIFPDWTDGPVFHRSFAMQPIYTASRDVLGYELFHRGSHADRFTGEPDMASNTMIDNLLLFGQEEPNGAFLFVNCTRATLTGGFLPLLPHNAVIEILETVVPDAEVLAACRQLKKLGYLISIDDFEDAETMRPFLDLADFVKIDFRLSGSDERRDLARKLEGRQLIRIAEKIETEAEFQLAIMEGCKLFQGNYLQKAVTFSKVGSCPCPFRLRQLVEALLDPTSSREEQIDWIRGLPEIEARLLRRAGWKARVEEGTELSISQALQIVGVEEFGKVLHLAMMTMQPA